jgi:(1->4)-alpha-D-glucan 1-alpha-D-glucosylmutase
MKRPSATYRLQFRDGMTFEKAAAVPYLKRLGVSHLYASPVFTAAAGSTHGYDVTDCNEIDPAIGGRAGFDRLCETLREAGLGLILDIVPNHMAASLDNEWWRSVVEWGEASPYGRHFDVDWSERLTLPVLGRSFGEALSANELGLRLDPKNGSLALGYFDYLPPLHPPTYPMVLDGIDDALARQIAEAASDVGPGQARRMHLAIRNLLSDASATRALQQKLVDLSADRALLERLHEAQPWRLVYWQEARRHLTYRRFFEVTGLIGLRVEDDIVFDDVHRLVLDLVRSGQVDGLRIDHVDGLADPTGYLQRLRGEIGDDTYLVVEKILEQGETLPGEWPVAGTTGYEFIASLAALMTDERRGRRAELDRAYAECRGGPADLEHERRLAKTMMVSRNFEGEVSTLVSILSEIAETGEDRNRLSASELRAALCALIVAFPVYRTYGNARGLPERDRALIGRIAAKVRRDDPGLHPAALQTVLAALEGEVTKSAAGLASLVRTRFQQLTGPVMAKAVEDTLFYRFNRLIARNEVGDDPGNTAPGPESFHREMSDRVRLQPFGLLATATHDTKRGEDARARLYVISEAPGEWNAAVAHWCTMNSGAVRMLPDGPAPEPDIEWLLYQALAGAWPEDLHPQDDSGLDHLRRRFLPYVQKALREAKLRTSWTDINETYEEAVEAYAARLLSPGNRAFLNDFTAVLQPYIRAGAINSLAQTLIKMTAPGVPDVYQGSEEQDFSFVDPDNRCPVDFAHLGEQLRTSMPAWPQNGVRPPLGALKQHVVRGGLMLRSRLPELFSQGSYTKLEVTGRVNRHVVAFARQHDGDLAVTVAPRVVFELVRDGRDPRNSGFWGGASVPLPGADESLTEFFSGRRYEAGRPARIAALFQDWPFAVLTSRPIRLE